jgi:protein-disulfide isomerase
MRSIPFRAGILSGFLMLALVAGAAHAQSTREVSQATLDSIVAAPLASPASGSAHSDVTIVEYFDYNCPVCREIDPELRRLIASDPKVRVIHKDWPLFGDGSVYATYCSFAAAQEGKYQVAHDALIGSKDDLDSKQDVQKVMRDAGFDMKAIDADIARHKKEYAAVVARNERETSTLRLEGTPGLVIGNQLVLVGVDYPKLVRLVTQARKNQAQGAGAAAQAQ